MRRAFVIVVIIGALALVTAAAVRRLDEKLERPGDDAVGSLDMLPECDRGFVLIEHLGRRADPLRPMGAPTWARLSWDGARGTLSARGVERSLGGSEVRALLQELLRVANEPHSEDLSLDPMVMVSGSCLDVELEGYQLTQPSTSILAALRTSPEHGWRRFRIGRTWAHHLALLERWQRDAKP